MSPTRKVKERQANEEDCPDTLADPLDNTTSQQHTTRTSSGPVDSQYSSSEKLPITASHPVTSEARGGQRSVQSQSANEDEQRDQTTPTPTPTLTREDIKQDLQDLLPLLTPAWKATAFDSRRELDLKGSSSPFQTPESIFRSDVQFLNSFQLALMDCVRELSNDLDLLDNLKTSRARRFRNGARGIGKLYWILRKSAFLIVVIVFQFGVQYFFLHR